METITGKLTILSGDFAVGPSLTIEGLRFAKTLGFASVINATPSTGADLEDANATEMAMRVREFGMTYRQFNGDEVGEVDADELAEFQKLVEDLPNPIFVYSATGLRATALWAASMSDNLSADEIKAAAKRAGHEISGVDDQSSVDDPAYAVRKVA